jgi:hypothetical protein
MNGRIELPFRLKKLPPIHIGAVELASMVMSANEKSSNCPGKERGISVPRSRLVQAVESITETTDNY